MKRGEGDFNYEKTLIILSAKCNKNGEINSLRKVGTNENTVLDLQLESLEIEFDNKYVVLGENSQEWSKDGFTKIINSLWAESNSGYSLSLALEKINNNGEIWILYSDILFRDLKLSKLDKNENLIYVDKDWEIRFKDRQFRDSSLIELVKDDNNKDINLFYAGSRKYIKNSSELCGIIKLTNKSFIDIKGLLKNIEIRELKKLSTAELLEISRLNGVKYKSQNISGKYCQLNIDDDLIKFFLGTKAETLEKLRIIGLKYGNFLNQYKFTVKDWYTNQDKIIEKIIATFKADRIVIRSSCFEEDTNEFSSAGKYESQLSVACNYSSIKDSVLKVISSYGVNNISKDQVLVQKYLTNVDFSGVAFSRMIESNSPYISINLSSIDTTQVTSGNSCNEYFINRDSTNLIKDKNLKIITDCLLEIESLLNYSYLDIEFALVKNKLYVLQVRPLVIRNKECNETVINQFLNNSVSELKRVFNQNNQIYSLMSDWNPAEIIGKLPSVLSSSIYRYIITDTNWSLSRKLDNYKIVEGPLLINILGTEYVDVNKSIKSFIPNNLAEHISKKIEKKAYKAISTNPSLHDKLEFEILPTCIDLNWKKWEDYFEGILNKEELEIYKVLLIKNTKEIMSKTITTPFQKSIKELIKISCSDPKNKLLIAIQLIEQIKNNLAIQFARSARRAFIVTSWIKTALERNIISKSAEIGFYKSLHTISKEFVEDLANDNFSKEEIYFKYGHLRPNSYDIQSKCYLERDLIKNRGLQNKEKKNADSDIKSWENEKSKLIKEINSIINFEDLEYIEKIMKENIILRERNKFEFTKLLSSSLELIADYLNGLDISRNDASNISLQTLKDIAFSKNGSEMSKNIINQEIKRNLGDREIFKFIYKPDIIIKGDELLFDKSINCRPTFIGSEIVEGSILKLENVKDENKLSLDDKIIVIENADPGYDFIFGYKIKGLITMYGGSNSHMTIRCSELNVTAVIGLGHKGYNDIEIDSFFQINPALKIIKKIS